MNHRSLSLLLGSILFVGMAHAGVITLHSSVRATVENGSVFLDAELSNTGDALADDLRLVLETPFGNRQTNHLGHLDPGTTLHWSAMIEHPPEHRSGAFVAVARASYTDANGFPLFALFTLPYRVGAEVPRPAAAMALEAPMRLWHPSVGRSGDIRAESVPLESTTTLRLSLVPLSGVPHPASLRMILPESLGVVPPPPALSDLPLETRVLEITVTNRSALAGSRLPIAAVLDVEVAGSRQSIVAETVLEIGGVPETAEGTPPRPLPKTILGTVLVFWLLLECRGRKRPVPSPPGLWLDAAVLAAVVWTLGRQLAVPDWFRDTLAVGGDIPAHHYLVAQLRESLARGRVVSWAPGWWCGFPAFQYYFPLPYLLINALDLVLPYNVAFKLGAVAGVFLLPFGAYAGGRLLRLRRPIPALLASATLPLLLDTTHTMWGVNLYSTLAGMIANSYSFAIFPAALASVVRDALDRHPRFRTVVLLVLLLLSHFFTSVVLALLVGMLFLALLAHSAMTRDARSRLGALVLIPLGVLSLLLMAWWLVPLLATRPWSVDFGAPWSIRVFHNLPLLGRWTLIPGVACCTLLLARPPATLPRAWRVAAGLHLVLMLLALGLFFRGGAISPVFVNCRLWPFWTYSVLTLAALAAGAAVSRARAPVWATATCVAGMLAFPWDAPNHALHWARQNFRGVESLREGPVFDQLADILRGSPGRLAADLHVGNEQLGSSRIFEAMPFRCGKPILEGGLVNSALGALAAYSVQGEISDQPAGWPLLVQPHRFDPAAGFRRIELMGATHFVARSRTVQRALVEDPAWALRADLGKWHLYENRDSGGELVRVWKEPLPYLRTQDPQRDLVRWLQGRSTIATPWVLVRDGEPAPPCGTELRSGESALARDSGEPPPPGYLNTVSRPVPATVPAPGRIRFHTDAPGLPHLVAVSYFPNWHVRGARHVYCAAPGFLLVYPEEHDVELWFGRTRADSAGLCLTLLGLLVLALWGADAWRNGRRPAPGITSAT